MPRKGRIYLEYNVLPATTLHYPAPCSASTKFASVGYDPILAAAKAKAVARRAERQELDALDLRMAGAGATKNAAAGSRGRKGGSAVKTMPATPYNSTWSSRTLSAVLPSLPRERGSKSSSVSAAGANLGGATTTRRPGLVKPRLSVGAAPNGSRPQTTQDGVIIPSQAIPEGDPAYGAFSMLKELAFVPVGASGSALGSTVLQPPVAGGCGDTEDDVRSTISSAGSYRPFEALQTKKYGGPRAKELLAAYPQFSIAGSSAPAASTNAEPTTSPYGFSRAAAAGTMTRALQATQMGSSLPGAGGAHRGGFGLIVGRLTLHRDRLVPATLVTAKWGRVCSTAYGASITDPVSLTLEMNPLYYESFMMDMASVTDGGDFSFEPEVSPAVFMLDIGRANKTVHGVEMNGDDPLEGAREDAAACAADATRASSAQRRTAARRASLSVVTTGGEGAAAAAADPNCTAIKALAAATGLSNSGGAAARTNSGIDARLPYEALKRHEIREAVKQARRRAEEYLLGLARVGDEPGIDRVLTRGYDVEVVPHPWYRNISTDSVGGTLTRGRRSRAGSRGRPCSGGRTRPSSAGASASQQQQRQRRLTDSGGGGGGDDDSGCGLEGTAGGTVLSPRMASARPDSSGSARSTTPRGRPRSSSGTALALVSRSGSVSRTGSRRALQKEIIPILPDVNCRDPEGNTPLILAAKGGWVEAARTLLKHGADHKRRNNAGARAHDLARIESELASAALSAALPGAGERKQRTALTAALLDDRSLLEVAAQGDLRRVRFLIEIEGHAVNSSNGYGMTALHFAVMKRDPEMVKYLCARGADAYARNNVGQTPASLCMDAMGGDEPEGMQETLLEALNEGPATVQKRAAAEVERKRAAADVARADAELVRKLREVTRGTTAAKAVALAMGGDRPRFDKPANRRAVSEVPQPRTQNSEEHARARLARDDSGSGSGIAASPALKLTVAQRDEVARSSASLQESWNRHALQYVSLQAKAVAVRDAKAKTAQARAGIAVDGERRRRTAEALPFTPGDAWRVQARAEATAAVDAHPARTAAGGDGGVLRSATAYSIWSTPAMLAAYAARPPAAEPEFDMTAALNDPSQLTLDVKAHAPPPAATDMKFDSWMRARFGAQVAMR